jgi:hypothetical protein
VTWWLSGSALSQHAPLDRHAIITNIVLVGRIAGTRLLLRKERVMGDKNPKNAQKQKKQQASKKAAKTK